MHAHTFIIIIMIIAIINGSLTIIRHPTENEGIFADNRTGIELGSEISINCAAETSNHALSIQILWIRDGKTIDDDSSHHIYTTNLTSNLNITNFRNTDAGVYQCVFNAEKDLITTTPFRLQTG